MAEFLNLQSNIEINSDDRFDFGSICKIWLKIDLWSIQDAARLISGIPPQSIADEENIKSNTAYKVNLEIITGCLGKSLSYSMNKFEEKPRINPNNLLNWAINKKLPINSILLESIWNKDNFKYLNICQLPHLLFLLNYLCLENSLHSIQLHL